jgi:outer membrane protein assembly factor BamC
MRKLIGLPILALILCSCSFKPLTDKFNEVTAPDYVNSSKAEKLQLPPDLSEYETSDTYNVPGAATSYTDFENQRNRTIEKVELLKDPEGIKLVKSGNFRWLIVNKSPDKIWPHLEDFWYEQGFNMKKTNRRLGIMETEWTTPENIEEELGIADTFDSWLDSLSGDDEKTKFRTRLEKGSQVNSTEIFISHRNRDGVNTEAMQAIARARQGTYDPGTVYSIPEYKSDDDPKEEAVPSGDKELTEVDVQINAEIMRRLLVFLGMQDLEAKKTIEKPQVIVKAKLVNNDGKSIELYEPFDRSWRRVSIALDMIGFLTEDKDRSKGLYYVTYTNLDIGEADKKAKEEEGWLDSIDFWSDDEAEAEEMAEAETGAADGDIRKKGRRAKKEKEDEVLDVDGARVLNKGGANQNEGPGYKFDLDCMFSDECDKEPEARSYLIKLTEADSGTDVSIENPDGTKNNSPTADLILNILYDYLK